MRDHRRLTRTTSAVTLPAISLLGARNDLPNP